MQIDYQEYKECNHGSSHDIRVQNIFERGTPLKDGITENKMELDMKIWQEPINCQVTRTKAKNNTRMKVKNHYNQFPFNFQLTQQIQNTHSYSFIVRPSNTAIKR